MMRSGLFLLTFQDFRYEDENKNIFIFAIKATLITGGYLKFMNCIVFNKLKLYLKS